MSSHVVVREGARAPFQPPPSTARRQPRSADRPMSLGDALVLAQRRIAVVDRVATALGWTAALLSIVAAGALYVEAPLPALGLSGASLLMLGICWLCWLYTASERRRCGRLGHRWLRRLRREHEIDLREAA